MSKSQDRLFEAFNYGKGEKAKLTAKQYLVYSFLMSIPAILGAMVLELLDFSMTSVSSAEIVYYIIGTVIAGLVGYICIKLMLAVVRGKKFKVFAIYCLIVGIISIAGHFYVI